MSTPTYITIKVFTAMAGILLLIIGGAFLYLGLGAMLDKPGINGGLGMVLIPGLMVLILSLLPLLAFTLLRRRHSIYIHLLLAGSSIVICIIVFNVLLL